MKLQCDLCKEIVAAEFSVTGNAIEVACPSCKGAFTVAARGTAPVVELASARAAKRAPADGEPSMTCPKCGDAQPPAAACRTCGLLAERMGEFQRDRDTKVPSEVTEAWEAVSAAWSDPVAHDQFVRVASTSTAYTWAAQRYRDAIRLRPDDALAASQLARLAKMAEATLLATAVRTTKAGAKPYRKVTILIVGVIVFAVLGIVYAITVSRSAPDDAPAHRPPKPSHVGAHPKGP